MITHEYRTNRIVVTLAVEEGIEAAIAGLRCRWRAELGKYGKKHGQDKEMAYRDDIEGACGERAVAKYLEVPWNPDINAFKNPDVSGYQVRTTTWHSGKLLLRPGDPSEHIYILVTGEFPTYVIRGWLTGAQAKQERFLSDGGNPQRPPCYLVKQCYLNPTTDLRKGLDHARQELV